MRTLRQIVKAIKSANYPENAMLFGIAFFLFTVIAKLNGKWFPYQNFAKRNLGQQWVWWGS